MNNWNFVGNLGSDCETRFTPKGDAVTSFNVAVKSGYGEKALTTWVNCNLWGKQAESLAPYLTKGQKVAVSGEAGLREYTTKDGTTGKSLEVRVNSVTLVGGKSEVKEDEKPKAVPLDKTADFDDFESNIPF